MCFPVRLSKLEFIERKVLEIHVQKLIPLPCAAGHHSTFFILGFSDALITWCEAFPNVETVF